MSAIFNPPLSTQRYCWVQDFILQDPSIKSVTDVGCGNGRMVIWLKHISNLDQINCIDRSLPNLEDGIDDNFRPNLHEMLFGRKDSDRQLDIQVYHGDIIVPDDRLKADCFTMVELIEHIPLDHLEKVCQTVFGYYTPRFIVVTTPNVEFNPLIKAYAASLKAKRKLLTLEQMPPTNEEGSETIVQQRVATESSQENESKFRHHDHKFEWNRAEFSQWADLMCKTYSYEVFMSGVGELPGSESFGPCTQIALFRRQENSLPKQSKTLPDQTLFFDLLLNKLSIQEEEEFLGDHKLSRICLRAKYQIPGTRTHNVEQSNHSAQWNDTSDDEMAESNDWPSHENEAELAGWCNDYVQ